MTKALTAFRLKYRSAIFILIAAALTMLLSSCGENEKNIVDQTYVSQTDIVINEVLASNTESYQAFDGRYYDWVELYNPSAADYPLDRYYLSDDQDNPRKCSLAGQTVPAKGYLIIFCSGLNITDERGYLHTNFRLSASKGEVVCLSDEHGVSTLTVPECETNQSYGLIDGKPSRLDKPTPGAPNDGAAAQTDTGVIINEFMTSNTYTIYDCEGDYGDWVELRNTTGHAIDLAGFTLTDNPKKPYAFVFPEGASLPANGYLLIFCDGKNRTDSQGLFHTGFSLSPDDQNLILMTPDRLIADSVAVPEMPDNISCGRYENETGFSFFARPTPGRPNDTPAARLSAGLTPDINDGVLISEVLSASSNQRSKYHSDYIEIFNSTGSDVNMKGYAISQTPGEAVFTFPDVTLPSGEYVLVYCDGTAKFSADDLHAPIKINTGGERFYLADPSGRICDDFSSGKCRSGMSSGRIGNETSRRVFFASPTPGAANSGQYYECYAPVPTVSIYGGLVPSGTCVSLSAPEGCTIVYTLDGSAPGENSAVYTSPIRITENTVLRAASTSVDCAISNCITETYFIENPHSLPIVSVSGSPDSLISSYGILNKRENYSEVPIHVEFFDESCRKAVEFDCGAKHVGKNSLMRDQKALKLMLREIYGQNSVSYGFFDQCQSAPTTFSSLLLRPSGQDQDRGKMRDELVASILRGENIIDYQEVRPCALYVDAQYWGLYYIRETLNASFVQNHHGLAKGDFDLIRAQSHVQEGSITEYDKLTEYCESHDLTVPEYYNYVCSVVDIDSLINFWIIETFFNNPDTDNIRCFKAGNGKWQWIPFDFDLAMYTSRNLRHYNYIKSYLLNPKGHGFAHLDNVIIRKLLNNSEFRDRFITLYCWHIQHTFAPERTVPILEQLTDQIDGEMKLNAKRWGYPSYKSWKESGPDTLRDFLEKKPEVAMSQLRSSFNLTEEELAAYCSDTPPEGLSYLK